jgi:hypothetical protein
MRAALRGKVTFQPLDWPEAVKQDFLSVEQPRYCWFKLDPFIRQDERDFFYAVAPFKVNDQMTLEQYGAGVLCETETEAKESFQKLTERSKKFPVVAQWAGYGTVGWVTNHRQIGNEISVIYKTLPDGKVVWIAREREIDEDTLEVKLIRFQRVANETEAKTYAQAWLNEYNEEKRKYLESAGKSLTPPAPPHCAPLSKSDLQDIAMAKIEALRKMWPHCFELFDRQKATPSLSISNQEYEDAYLIDLVEHGAGLWNAAGGSVRADMGLISALHKAGERHAKRGKSNIIDTAIFLVAFNWDLGWCYFSDRQLADKLNEILKTSFTENQVKKYRYRKLGLVAKHMPGPELKSPGPEKGPN